MKISKHQELDHIISITAGLLASGHFTYVRQDGKGAEVRQEAVETAETVWGNIKTANGIEIGEVTASSILGSRVEIGEATGALTAAEAKAKTEARRGKN